MVYWAVDKRAVCIYSQLKTSSSSEVAAMLEGLLRHGTEMPIEKNYDDSHGQSANAFAFCHLPRLAATPLPCSPPSAPPTPGTRTCTSLVLCHAQHTRHTC
jgi:Tn3 transposase DDE domain